MWWILWFLEDVQLALVKELSIAISITIKISFVICIFIPSLLWSHQKEISGLVSFFTNNSKNSVNVLKFKVQMGLTIQSIIITFLLVLHQHTRYQKFLL